MVSFYCADEESGGSGRLGCLKVCGLREKLMLATGTSLTMPLKGSCSTAVHLVLARTLRRRHTYEVGDLLQSETTPFFSSALAFRIIENFKKLPKVSPTPPHVSCLSLVLDTGYSSAIDGHLPEGMLIDYRHCDRVLISHHLFRAIRFNGPKPKFPAERPAAFRCECWMLVCSYGCLIYKSHARIALTSHPPSST